MITSAQSLSEISKKNISLWLLLAFQAGAINTGGLMAFHRFVSHMTGFASHFGLELASGNMKVALSMASVPLFFLSGSILAALVIDHPIYTQKEPHYIKCAFLIFILLTIALVGGRLGYFGVFGQPEFNLNEYILIATLALSAGLQNATITSTSGATIRTTHLTGITTDLGIGLVRVLFRDYTPTVRTNEVHANWIRAGLIFSFIIGSIISAYLYIQYEYSGFALPVATSLCFLFFTIHRKWLQNKVLITRNTRERDKK